MELCTAQYTVARNELLEKQKLADQTSKFTVISVGAIASWLATNAPLEGQEFIYWLPFLIAVASFFRYLAYQTSVKLLGKYIANLESRLSLDERTGWQLFWNKKSQNIITRLIYYPDFFLWSLVFGASAWFGYNNYILF